MLLRGPANRWAIRSPLRAQTPTTQKPEILKETLAKTPLYDLGAGRKLRPLFDSLCQRATVRNQDQGAYQPRSGQPGGRRRTQGTAILDLRTSNAALTEACCLTSRRKPNRQACFI